jgi:hypothetical protein
VAEVLRLGFTVVHDPLPDDRAHALARSMVIVISPRRAVV